MKKLSSKEIVIIALMAAIMCIVAPFSISIAISPVPITLAMFILYMMAYVLRPAKAGICVVIYLLLGLVGLPVFSGYSGGFAKLAGPTGGYLIGYIFTAVICSVFIWKENSGIILNILGMVLGLAAAYAFGTAWFCISYEMGVGKALMMCVVPYLPADAVKIIIAALAGPAVRKRLIKAGLI